MVCPSVCLPSVTSRYYVQMAKLRITQTTPYPMTLNDQGFQFSDAKDHRKIPIGPPTGAPNAGEVG